MRWLDRGRLRSACFTALITVVFLLVNAQVAHAAETSGGDMLSPLNIKSSEGVPINGYELSAEGGSIFSFKSNAYAFVMNGLFTLLRLVVGLACWAIGYAFKFPLLKMLADPAQKAADAYNHAVVDTLGLKGLLLAWAFVFGLILFVRGKAGKGLGEIALTLVIGALAASAFVRPDYLLAQNGPLAQTEQAAAEVARDTVNSHYWGGKIASDQGPCAGMAGHAELKCLQIEGAKPLSPAEVARPIQDSLTNALVVKGYMLLEYGRVLDPAKEADRKAYALHLKWVSGGYKPENQPKKNKDACSLLRGPARQYCEQGATGQLKSPGGDQLPALTTGDALLQASQPVLTEEDQQFAAFLKDLEEAGPVGKACAQYAAQPTGWRTAGALMLFIAALLICAIPLSAAVVLLGTQAADAGAATIGGISFVWGMLPGPSRQAVWKWAALFIMSVAVMFLVCMFLPFYGIGVDVVFTDGPELPAERLLVLDVLGIAGLAFHRLLMRGISGFGQRLALRMRYAKVGGTHLPGDTSEIGAALAVHTAAGAGFGIGGLRSLAMSASYGQLGTRHRLMGSLASLMDGTGMPLDPGRLLADAGAEASRGLAPLALATTGLRLGARGGWGLLVGRRPDDQALERWRKPTADVDTANAEGEAGAGGPARRRGPADRYRDPDGTIADRDSGTLLHDQHQDRTLLSTRAHNRLVRLRGYRILHRAGRIAYGSSWGLPENIRRGHGHSSRYTQDARQQVKVWGNTVREDGRAWVRVGSTAAQRLREEPSDRGATAPFTGRTLRSTSPRTSGLSAPGAPAAPPVPPATPPPRPTASPATPTPPPTPTPPAAPDPAELRRRIIDRLGSGDPPETRRVQDEMRRRFGDPDADGDGG
ncbi:hypothetical protein DWB77_00078 [Streptomyces hundungensis]|uniref:Uncharacterized protein n=1 Tax=Streptomyces hundungensis TaxID=1077946 RepID=A0A387H629_9ACTN|nr:hypothetical protein [Streptomyces hundungensis]AYG77971.1 hypothetical protein DWB77_00078 [Streptomyces hundungensis]